MTTYLESTLGKDEQVVEMFKIHKLPFIAAALWAVLFLFLAAAANAPVMLVFAFGCGLIFWSLKSIEQGVTNRRVVVKKGIVSRKTDELRAEKVEHVNVRQGIVGRILGYGDVLVRGTGGGVIHIRTVSNPVRVKTVIEDALRLG